ncbi:MAG TPA: hypothetical protein VMJ52_06465 [Xanthobacteraceae bacterium]|nr:hypothetical protein [Xanthobacteraceae bacterium]
MLAEIFMIRLEAAMTATTAQRPAAARFVPFDRGSFGGFKADRARLQRPAR